jgi:uncharacterized protein (TIGR02996 family)
MDDLAFLARIAEEPDNTTLRLVYADWLEEQCDPRGEYLRLQEEMFTLPIYSDRYWELKQQRNPIREQIPPDWLTKMGYDDVRPVFAHGIPEGWKERWRLIREFVDRWHQIPLGDVGGHSETIDEMESELGLTFPPSMREFVALSIDVRYRRKVFGEFDCLVEELPRIHAISILFQPQLSWAVCLEKKDLHLPDPPVHGLEDHFFDESFPLNRFEIHTPLAPKITEFALAQVIENLELPTRERLQNRQTFDRLSKCLNEIFPVKASLGPIKIYENRNLFAYQKPSIFRGERWINVQFSRQFRLRQFPKHLRKLFERFHSEDVDEIPF